MSAPEIAGLTGATLPHGPRRRAAAPVLPQHPIRSTVAAIDLTAATA